MWAHPSGALLGLGKQQTEMEELVQYVIVRVDLKKALNYNLGAIVGNSCHASVAAMAENLDDEDTKLYISKENLDHMHKIVLGASDLEELKKVSEELTQKNIIHKIWVEQPENVPTTLALKPYRRTYLKEITQNTVFSKLKLLK